MCFHRQLAWRLDCQIKRPHGFQTSVHDSCCFMSINQYDQGDPMVMNCSPPSSNRFVPIFSPVVRWIVHLHLVAAKFLYNMCNSNLLPFSYSQMKHSWCNNKQFEKNIVTSSMKILFWWRNSFLNNHQIDLCYKSRATAIKNSCEIVLMLGFWWK